MRSNLLKIGILSFCISIITYALLGYTIYDIVIRSFIIFVSVVIFSSVVVMVAMIFVRRIEKEIENEKLEVELKNSLEKIKEVEARELHLIAEKSELETKLKAQQILIKEEIEAPSSIENTEIEDSSFGESEFPEASEFTLDQDDMLNISGEGTSEIKSDNKVQSTEQ